MKKTGTFNQPLSEVIAGMGHGDMLVVADCGLPIPSEVRRIDLALSAGIPGFLQTLKVILGDLQVESALIATEMLQKSPHIHKQLMEILGDITVTAVDHEDFKKLTRQAVAIVRTGECTAYANIILKSGVIF